MALGTVQFTSAIISIFSIEGKPQTTKLVVLHMSSTVAKTEYTSVYKSLHYIANSSNHNLKCGVFISGIDLMTELMKVRFEKHGRKLAKTSFWDSENPLFHSRKAATFTPFINGTKTLLYWKNSGWVDFWIVCTKTLLELRASFFKVFKTDRSQMIGRCALASLK